MSQIYIIRSQQIKILGETSFNLPISFLTPRGNFQVAWGSLIQFNIPIPVPGAWPRPNNQRTLYCQIFDLSGPGSDDRASLNLYKRAAINQIHRPNISIKLHWSFIGHSSGRSTWRCKGTPLWARPFNLPLMILIRSVSQGNKNYA